MQYDLQGILPGGRGAILAKYDFAPYTTWKITQGTKYPALLNNSEICITFAPAFEDLANKLGIPCRVILGFTGMEHAWNIVLINNEIKYIDVDFALMYRKNVDKKRYFLRDVKDLGNRTIESDIEQLALEMKKQYDQTHPRIKIIRQETKNEPPIRTITIRSKNDNQESKGMMR